MSPRLEFLGYFVVLLVGIFDYMVHREMSPGPLFIAGVVVYLVALRFLCRQLAKRFTYDRAPARSEP